MPLIEYLYEDSAITLLYAILFFICALSLGGTANKCLKVYDFGRNRDKQAVAFGKLSGACYFVAIGLSVILAISVIGHTVLPVYRNSLNSKDESNRQLGTMIVWINRSAEEFNRSIEKLFDEDEP